AGGLLSVALSRGSLRVGVTHRPALWSPDVPRRAHARRDRPADPFARASLRGEAELAEILVVGLGQARGADDPRVVAVRRRRELRARRNERRERRGVLRHATAHTDQVGGDQELDVVVAGLQASGPLLLRQPVALARRGRREALERLAVPDQVPQPRVRHELALEEEGGADAGAK